MIGAVPATAIYGPTRTPRENPISGSKLDLEFASDLTVIAIIRGRFVSAVKRNASQNLLELALAARRKACGG
jgi:hypothetical protein